MKRTMFKIRNLVSSSKEFRTDERNELASNEGRHKSSTAQRLNFEELMLDVQKMIEESRNINVNLKLGELEARDRQIFASTNIPQNKHSPEEVEAWIGEVCRDIMSSAFHYYVTEQMSYEQTKIYCCQGILKSISRCVENSNDQITPDFYCTVDKILKEKILPYLGLKYPASVSNQVNKKFNKMFKEINNMQVITNDFFYNSDITFEYRENGDYNDLIMQVINQIIKIPDSNTFPDQQMMIKTNYEDFEEFVSELFEKVYDKEWILKGINEKIPKSSSQNDIINQKGQQERQKYKEQVKDYTHYLIGRKIPENVQEFSQSQIKSGFLNIRSPTILRIITKWCEQLWEKFDNQNYYLDRTEGMMMTKGKQINIVYHWIKDNLKVKMAAEKQNILQYMKKIEENNYEQQYLIMQSEQNTKEASFLDKHQRICGKFSIKLVKNLQNYLVVYLNRLIHGLMTVSKLVFQLMNKIESWPHPPNLLSFKVGDLLRCKCSSKQRQILRIFEQMQQISEKNPKKLKIIRIKNRLKLGTNDILINVRFNNCLTAQIQLKVQSKRSSSQFSLYSYNFSHLIYQIERSFFGPISQICSIWTNLDPKITMFNKLITKQQLKNQTLLLGNSECLKTANDHRLVTADNTPFICSKCCKSFSNNNYAVSHQSCKKCKYWKCALCIIKQTQESGLIQLVIQDEQLKSRCKPQRCTKTLPKYFIGILIQSKLKEITYFKMIEVFQKKYIFKDGSNQHFQLYKQLSTKDSITKFLEESLVFQLKVFNNFPQIDDNQLINQCIFPAYVKKCYKFQKQTLSLNDLKMFHTKPSDFASILEGSKQHKKHIKFIEISSNNINQIDFLSHDFKNLQFLNINVNKINDLKHLAGFLKLQTLFAIGNQISQISPQLCSLKIKHLSLYNNKIAALPLEFAKLKQLQILKIEYNLLTSFPQNFEQLENLKELYAKKNHINNIEYLRCPKLQHADISQNNIATLPKGIQALVNLTYFKVSQNNITAILAEFNKLKKLKVLLISNNRLTQMPSNLYGALQLTNIDISFQKFSILNLSGGFFSSLKNVNLIDCSITEIIDLECFKSVELLNLQNNKLSVLPQNICGLTNIKILKLSSNILKELPSRFGELQQLKELMLNSNCLQSFPSSFFQLKLQILNFNKNKFTVLSNELMQIKTLRKLQFENNKIEKLPATISSLQNLELLNILSTQIKQLPFEMNSLKKLKKLIFNNLSFANLNPFLLKFKTDYNSCKIEKLPQIIPKYYNIYTLNLNQNQISSIPKSIANIINIKSLNLNRNRLTEINDVIFQLANLAFLSMSFNTISVIPDRFEKLTFLTSLFLSNNKIQMIPISLQNQLKKGLNFKFSDNPLSQFPGWLIECSNQFSNHQLLNLSNYNIKHLPNIPHFRQYKKIIMNYNQLKTVPSAINKSSQLKSLSLQNNSIKHLQNFSFQLPNLQLLNISNNQIQEIPECFKSLTKLMDLCVQKNPLKKLPNSFKQIHLKALRIDLACLEHLSQTKSLQLIHTKEIIFSENDFESLPQCFGEIGYLQSFVIINNMLKELPQSFTNLTHLAKLSITGTSFQRLPQNIEKLQNLECFQLKSCNLSKLPQNFCKLINLRFIWISKTQLQQLPEQIGCFVKLKQLNIRQNKSITKLPSSIGQLKNMQVISFKENKITQFPVGIGKCERLKKIFAQKNLIKIVPKQLDQLKQLNDGGIQLQGNPIEEIECLQFIIKKGNTATLKIAEKVKQRMKEAKQQQSMLKS